MIYEVTLLGSVEEKRNYPMNRVPDVTIGLIQVKPPINIESSFGAVILGRGSSGVSLTGVGSTEETTVLMAEVGRFDTEPADRHSILDQIVGRVALFANSPEQSIELFNSSPFSPPSVEPRIGTGYSIAAKFVQ